MADCLEVIKTRRSVRRFKPDPIPRKALEEIAEAGRWAPTAHNEQPWEFVVVTDPEMRKRLAGMTDYGRFIAEAPACIIVFCRDTKYYIEDGCAAVENMLLAAWAMGIGSCWVAGDKKPYARRFGEVLGVPESHRLVASIALGYPAAPPKRPSRRPLKEILHWEKY